MIDTGFHQIVADTLATPIMLEQHPRAEAYALDIGYGKLIMEPRWSHGVLEGPMPIACYRMIGGLYLTVIHERDKGVINVLVLAKPVASNRGKKVTFTDMAVGKKFATIEDYIALFKGFIQGGFYRQEADTNWTAIAL